MIWGAEYLAAWNTHDVEAVVALFAADCRYVDMPHDMLWEGHDGIRTMFAATAAFVPDYEFTWRGGFRDDRHYAVEWTLGGSASGRSITHHVVSVGSFDDHDRIVEHRDYWNAKDLEPK